MNKFTSFLSFPKVLMIKDESLKVRTVACKICLITKNMPTISYLVLRNKNLLSNFNSLEKFSFFDLSGFSENFKRLRNYAVY